MVIRWHDGVIVVQRHSFPESGRALMYKQGDIVSSLPLQDDDRVGTPTHCMEMPIQAVYVDWRPQCYEYWKNKHTFGLQR